MEANPEFISSYFEEERVSAFLMIIIGTISVMLSLFFLFIIKYSFFKGMAIPFLLIGCLQCITGTTIAIRSSKDIERVKFQLSQEPQKIKSEELPRIKKVLVQFTVYKWIEITLIFIGLFLFVLFFNSTQSFWKGIGLGLLLPSAVLFFLDFAAEKRAELYLEYLSNAI